MVAWGREAVTPFRGLTKKGKMLLALTNARGAGVV